MCPCLHIMFSLRRYEGSAAKLVLFIRLLVLLRLFEKIWSYFGLIFEVLVLFLQFCPSQFFYIQNHHCVLLNDNSNKYSMLCMQIRCITGPKHSYEYISGPKPGNQLLYVTSVKSMLKQNYSDHMV